MTNRKIKLFIQIILMFLLIIAIIGPSIISFAYKVSSEIDFDKPEYKYGKNNSKFALITMYDENTAVLYLGSVLAFLGTAFLGYVAFIQNKTSIKQNDSAFKQNEAILKLQENEQESKKSILAIDGTPLRHSGLKTINVEKHDNHYFFIVPLTNKGPIPVIQPSDDISNVYFVEETFPKYVLQTFPSGIPDGVFQIEFEVGLKTLYGSSYKQLFKINIHFDTLVFTDMVDIPNKGTVEIDFFGTALI